jgi:hypothetical protein
MKVFRRGKKHIGTLNGNIFSKEVVKSKHLFRVLNAWGIDEDVLKKLPADAKIIIHELEEDTLNKATKKDYKDYGEYFHFKDQKEDHAVQRFLPLSRFMVEKPKKLEGDDLAKHEYLKSQGLI